MRGCRVTGRPFFNGPVGGSSDRVAPPHSQCGGAGGRRVAAAPRRDFAGPPGGSVSGRAAGVSARRAGSAAGAAGVRHHYHFTSRQPGGISGALSADRGDEPVSVWLSWLNPARLSLHARPGVALPGQIERAAAGPHRPACGSGGAGGQRAGQCPARRGHAADSSAR